MFVEWFSQKMVGPFFIFASIAQRSEQAESINTNGRTPNQPWRHTAHATMMTTTHSTSRRSDSGTKHHTPPEAGGFHSEPSSMRLAQLPAALATRTKVLPRPRTRIQPAARQLNSTRIRRSTPPPPQDMGSTTGHRRNTHLRQMRTASHSHRPMGPRPHRQQTKLDRTGTQTLQQTRRTTQSNRKQRTLDATLSQATAATAIAANRQTANASTSMTQTNQTQADKPSKHTQQKQQNAHQNRKKYNQPTRQHP